MWTVTQTKGPGLAQYTSQELLVTAPLEHSAVRWSEAQALETECLSIDPAGSIR